MVILKPKYTLLVLFGLTIGCAAVGPPGGGPVDDIAPIVIGTNPPTGATGVPRDGSISVTFSEPVDAASLAEALFISPTPAAKPKIRLSGSTVRIILDEPLPEDRTVVITIGSGVRDVHNVPMQVSFSFAFSGSQTLSKGRIEGNLFSTEPVKGMLVGAYEVSSLDTIDPSISVPPFVTMTGGDGSFSLDYLSDGLYRLFCYDDRDKNRLYARGIDRLGLTWHDVELVSDSVAFVAFQPLKRDTIENRPIMAKALDNSRVQVRFSRPLKPKDITLLEQAVIYSGGYPLPTLARWIDPVDSSRANLWTRLPDNDSLGIVYWKGMDIELTFDNTNLADSTALKISSSYPASNASGIPANFTGWIAFDDILSDSVSFDSIKLKISDSLDWKIEIQRPSVNVLEWKPVPLPPPGVRCQLEIDLSTLSDVAGNRGDSLWTLVFTSADPAQWGSISGSISGIEPSLQIFVTVRRVKGVGRKTEPIVRVDPDNNFKLDGLESGDYIVWAWEDSDNDMTYSYGNLEPFAYAERFAVNPDTITVRSRWESGGILLKFR